MLPGPTVRRFRAALIYLIKAEGRDGNETQGLQVGATDFTGGALVLPATVEIRVTNLARRPLPGP